MSLKDDLLRDMEDQAVHYGGAVWIAEWAAKWMAERCSKIVGGYRVLHHAEHVWGVGEAERNRVCSYLQNEIRQLSKELQ